MFEIDKYELGKEMKLIRKQKKMTLEELGERTNFTKGYLSMLENGKTDKLPGYNTLLKIEKGLRVADSPLLKKAGYLDVLQEDHSRASYLTDLYYQSVLKWSENKFFNENETIIIKEHFLDLLLRYKEIVEGYSKAKMRWESSKEAYQEIHRDKLSDKQIKELFLEGDLKIQLQNASNWIHAFPSYIANNEDKDISSD